MEFIIDCYTPYRRHAHFRRFFETVTQISVTGKCPLVIRLVKLSFLLISFKHLCFYYLSLSPSTRWYLQDYAFIFKTGNEFNLIISLVMVGNCYFVLDLMYVQSGDSDYCRLPYRVIVFGRLYRYFMKSKTRDGVSIAKVMSVSCLVLSNCAVLMMSLSSREYLCTVLSP